MCTRSRRFATFAVEPQAYEELFTGNVRRADELAAEAARLAALLGDYLAVGHTIDNHAWIKCVAGDLDGGRQLVEPIVGAMEHGGQEAISFMALTLGMLHLAGGDLEGAVEWLERGTRFPGPTTDNWVTALALPTLAGALRRLGDRDAARRDAERGWRWPSGSARPIHWPKLWRSCIPRVR